MMKKPLKKWLFLFLFVKLVSKFSFKMENLRNRIEINPEVLTGKPVIKGTRLSVQFILGLLAHGETPESIIEEYNYITKKDIQACLLFANDLLDDNFFTPLAKSA